MCRMFSPLVPVYHNKYSPRNRFAGSPVPIIDMSHVGWNAQKRYAYGEALTRECVMWASLGVLPSNLSQIYLLNSIAIVDPNFLVIINVVKPVAIMLVQLVCCVDVNPGSEDTICAEEPAKWLRLNGLHSSLKPDPIMLPRPRVNSNYHIDREMTLFLTFFEL